MCGAYLHFDAGAQWIGFNMTYKRQNGVEIMDGKLGPDIHMLYMIYVFLCLIDMFNR
jgi:hypothetical protein